MANIITEGKLPGLWRVRFMGEPAGCTPVFVVAYTVQQVLGAIAATMNTGWLDSIASIEMQHPLARIAIAAEVTQGKAT